MSTAIAGTSVSGESWSPLTDTKDDAKTVESGPPSLLFEKDLKLEALQKRFHALEETTAALKKLNEQRADERRELEDTAAALRKDCQRFSQEKQEMKEAVRVLQGECLQLCERNGELEEEIEVLKVSRVFVHLAYWHKECCLAPAKQLLYNLQAELTIAKSRARKSGSKQSESSEIPGTVQSSYSDPLWLSVAAMGAVTIAAGAVAIVRSRS